MFNDFKVGTAYRQENVTKKGQKQPKLCKKLTKSVQKVIKKIHLITFSCVTFWVHMRKFVKNS